VLPGISIGHNEYGGWGLTIFGQDNEDLYVYDTNPASPNQYRYMGGWEEMKVLPETIAIEGEPAETVELKYTRHGPVLYEDREHHKAYALRAAWMEIGSSPYLASLRMNQARTWEEFADACAYSRIPSENMIWGDVDKNIGYHAVGISPIRRNWSGLVPVPGDGRYEWDGYLPVQALPRIENPEKGYWGTANNYMVPDGYGYPEALHWDWGDEMRGVRVDELLSSGRRFTLVDMMEFQHDELSVPARNLVPLLRHLEISDPRSHALQLDGLRRREGIHRRRDLRELRKKTPGERESQDGARGRAETAGPPEHETAHRLARRPRRAVRRGSHRRAGRGAEGEPRRGGGPAHRAARSGYERLALRTGEAQTRPHSPSLECRSIGRDPEEARRGTRAPGGHNRAAHLRADQRIARRTSSR
jgi:hypothetical protein